MRISASPISNVIYAGKTQKLKNGTEKWTSKEDVTDEAIAAVFEWFMYNSKDEGNSCYQISFKGHGTLTYDPDGKIESEE